MTGRVIGLTASEREVVITYNDVDKTWRVYWDSATMGRALLRLARKLGIAVQRVGSHGFEFICPAEDLRLAARRRLRLSAEQRAARRARAFRQSHSLRAADGKATILTEGPGHNHDPSS